MPDGSRQALPTLRLVKPGLGDYVYVAQRMREDEQAQFLAMSGQATYDADACARTAAITAGPHYAYVERNGYPVLIGGFEPLRPGVYAGWQMATADGWATHWRSFHKASVRLMDELLASGAHRIEACALSSRLEAQAWYARLGMAYEGVLHGYCTDGQDGVMYARTRNRHG